MSGGDPWGAPSGGPTSGGWGDQTRGPQPGSPGSGGPGGSGSPAGGYGSGSFGPGSFGSGSGSFDPGGFGPASGPGASGSGAFGPGFVGGEAPSLPRPAQPPVAWLFGSLAAGLAGGTLAAALGSDPRWAFLGWALGGLVAIGLLAVFARADALRRAAPVRVDFRWVPGLYVTAAACALAAVVVGALRIAFWAGRL
jgi:hypothetical protein